MNREELLKEIKKLNEELDELVKKESDYLVSKLETTSDEDLQEAITTLKQELTSIKANQEIRRVGEQGGKRMGGQTS